MKVQFDILKELLSDYDQGGNHEESLLKEHTEREVYMHGQLISGFVIKSGVKKFQDFVTYMVTEFGESLTPFLKDFYRGVSLWPAIDKKGMDTSEYVEKFDLDSYIDSLYGRTAQLEFYISHPMMIRTHLLWLEEYEPEKLIELFNNGTLRGYLENTLQEAIKLRHDIMKTGKPEDMAMEVVNAHILAPLVSEMDIPIKNKRIGNKQINKIWISLGDFANGK